MWDQSSTKTETKSEEKTGEKTQTTTLTQTAMDRHSLKAAWLLPLSLTAVLGVFLGAYFRINGTLSFRDETLTHKLTQLGFTKDEINALRARWVKDMDIKYVLDYRPHKYAGLQAKDVPNAPPQPVHSTDVPLTWPDFWETMTRATPTQVVTNLLDENNRRALNASFQTVLHTNRQKKVPDADIVKKLKALTDVQP
jgi:hypothetical protein